MKIYTSPFLSRALSTAILACCFATASLNAQVPVISGSFAEAYVVNVEIPTYTITASNTPTSYGATSLPPGLLRVGETIVGTPSQAGVFNVTLFALNADGFDQRTLELTVSGAEIESSLSETATVGEPYTYQITANNGPTVFNEIGLVDFPGLSLDTATGLISGTPTEVRTSDIFIQAINGASVATALLVLDVSGVPPAEPTVTIDSPLNGADYTDGDPITLEITADDADGFLTQVKVFSGTIFLGIAQFIGVDQYSFQSNTGTAGLGVGTQNLTVQATDNVGNVVTSNPVVVDVLPKATGAAPDLSITSPTVGNSIKSGETLEIVVDAQDTDGFITSVEVFNNAVSLGLANPTGAANEYLLSYRTSAADLGNLNLQARAVDNQGNVGYSAVIDYSVVQGAVPVVTIDSPDNLAVFLINTPIPVSFTGTDADDSIVSVEVFSNGTSVGFASLKAGATNVTTGLYTGAYEFVLTETADAGLQRLTAVATDELGNSTTSLEVNVLLSNGAAPVVDIDTVNGVAPAGTPVVVARGSVVTLAIAASDSDGTVTQVEVYNGAVPVGFATLVAPDTYRFDYQASSPGLVKFQVRASDDLGNIGFSDLVEVSVVTGTLPIVSIDSPVNDADHTVGDLIALEITATDMDGFITRVEVFRGIEPNRLGEEAVFLGITPDGNGQYRYLLDTAALEYTPNTYQLRAKATDNSGNVVTTDFLVIDLKPRPTNILPTVSIDSPATGSFYDPGATITINVTADDADGEVDSASVEIFNGTDLIGLATLVAGSETQYSLPYTLTNLGALELTAHVKDDFGAESVSQPTSIVVTDAPQVDILNPTGSISYDQYSTISVEISASDDDGIAKVEVYNGDDLIGEAILDATTSTYKYEYVANSPGELTLTAYATDNLGRSISALRTIVIDALPVLTVLSPESGEEFYLSTTVTFTFSASDEDGIEKVEVYNGVDLIGIADLYPDGIYRLDHTPSSIGTYYYEAIATSTTGKQSRAQLVVFGVTTPPQGPAIKASSISGHQGTYAVGDEVVFNVTFTNTTTVVEAKKDVTTEAEAKVQNQANTANNFTVTGFLIGTDIYGNPVEVPVSISGGNQIGPDSTLEIEGKVTIPVDGTFHKLLGGYSIQLFYSYRFTPVGGKPVPVPLGAAPLELNSSSGILVDVPANLLVVNLAYPVKTFRGGDIIEITASIRNASSTSAIVRPLTADEDFRTEFYLSDDASVDRDNDFLLGFFETAGDSTAFINGRSQVRVERVSGTPAALANPEDSTLPDAFGRFYIPQPDDGFLDIGETISVTLEVLVPTNYTGTFFAAAYTDSLGEIVELEEDVNADFGDQGDNVFVDSFTPNFRIASSTAPNTLAVSEVSDGNGGLVAASDGVSDNPSMSEDGVWIAFQSSATNLDPDLAGSGDFNIYLRNRETEAVTLISRSSAGVIGNRDSFNPSISADGRYVAYESLAINLVSGAQGAGSQIYVYDLLLDRTERVSVTVDGIASNGSCYTPSISEDGRFIVFESLATNLDADFESDLASTFAVQAFVHDRGQPTASGEFGDDFATHLVSTHAGVPADRDVVIPKISLDGRVVVFASAATNLGALNDDFVTQIWSRELGPDGVPLSEPVLVSVNTTGAGGNANSTEPTINGGPTAPYGLQIAFASVADDLIANDTNGIADIFVRDFSAPAVPVTSRASVSNPRVAFGSIEFLGAINLDNAPANQLVAGETITLNDGINPALTLLTAGTDFAIGATTGETRDNLVTAINDAEAAGTLNMVAYASDAPTAIFNNLGLDGHNPSIQLFNTVPGEQGNQQIETTSLVLLTSDMSQGGTETGRSNDFSLGNPGGLVFGSLQPALDRSGRIVAFRSLTGGISVIRDGSRVYKPQSPTEDTPRVGEIIRPLNSGSSNVYFRDRDLSGAGTLDQVNNTDTSRASVNKFGYRTNQLLDTADSASSRMPALSANGRFIAFASDATNAGGLRFDRTNRQPLDSNNQRDVFVYDRNVVVPTTPTARLPFVAITSPEPGISISASSSFFISASALGYDLGTESFNQSSIRSVTFYINGEEEALVTAPPFVTLATPRGDGPLRILAVAEDINGNIATSTAVEITAEVLFAETPILTLVNPNSQINTEFTLGQTVGLAASVTQTAGSAIFRQNYSFTRASFYVNGVEVYTTEVESDFISSDYIFDRIGDQSITAAVIYRRNTTTDFFVNVFADIIQVSVTDVGSPAVRMTSPTSNSTIAFGSNVTLSARPTAVNGGALTVTYKLFIQAEGTVRDLDTADASTEFAFDWQVDERGALSFFALVEEVGAGQTVSSRIDVTSVVADNLPSAEITSFNNTDPNNERITVESGSVVLLRADVTGENSDTNDVASVEFYVNDALVRGLVTRQAGSSIYELEWVPSLVGDADRLGATIVAVVTSDENAISVNSSPVFVDVISGLTPVVSFDSPVGDVEIGPGTALNLQASSQVSGSTIREVQFFYRNTPGDPLSGNLIGTATSAPYTTEFSSGSVGTFYIYAVATSTTGLTGFTDNPIQVTVTSLATVYPTVSFVSPIGDVELVPYEATTGDGTATGGDEVAPEGATVTLRASAQVEGGTISKVEFFYLNAPGNPLLGTLIGADTSAPYTTVFSSGSVGTYYIYAVATSNTGGTGVTATSIQVTVAEPVEPVVTFVAPTAGDVVEIEAREILTLLASAEVEGGTISGGIRFYFRNTPGDPLLGTLIESVPSAPYTTEFSSLSEGIFYLYAVATSFERITGVTATPIEVRVTYSQDELFINNIFDSILGRSPTDSEVADGLEILDGSLESQTAYVVDLLDSSALDDTDLAMLVNRTMLGEWPDAEELAFARANLSGGTVGSSSETGSIEFGATETFEFFYNVGDAVTMRVTQDSAAGNPLTDATLTVNSPSGAQVGFSDDSIFGLDPLLTFTAAEAGTHTAIVGGFSQLQAGDFTITSFSTGSGSSNAASAQSLVTALIPEFESRFRRTFPPVSIAGQAANDLVTQLFRNKHRTAPDALALNRLSLSLTGVDTNLGQLIVPGYSGTTAAFVAAFALDNQLSQYPGLSSMLYYTVPNDATEDMQTALLIATLLDEDPTDAQIAQYAGMTIEEVVEAILIEILEPSASTWTPEGWVYYDYPYAYSLDEARWHYFDSSNTQWRVNLTTNDWGTLSESEATGWTFYAWPYSYSVDASTWHWYNDNEQWVVDLVSGVWALFGD